MIVAAGLTPAWQQILRFEYFRTGEVNRAVEAHWCASGKVANVGIALKHLDVPAETVALVGGAAGEHIEREFAQAGIATHWIAASRPTRVCTTILDLNSGNTTELVENAALVTEGELADFRKVYAQRAAQASVAVLTGSLPAGTPTSFYRDLLCDTPCPAVVDFRGPELLQALERGVWLAEPNREELALTVGRELLTDHDLRGAMQELNDRGAQWVLVSQGPRDLWASSAGKFYRFSPPRVATVNPIGSGDCLAAGIAAGVYAGLEPLESIRFGVAAAVENVGTLLPARLDPAAVRRQSLNVVVTEVT